MADEWKRLKDIELDALTLLYKTSKTCCYKRNNFLSNLRFSEKSYGHSKSFLRNLIDLGYIIQIKKKIFVSSIKENRSSSFVYITNLGKEVIKPTLGILKKDERWFSNKKPPMKYCKQTIAPCLDVIVLSLLQEASTNGLYSNELLDKVNLKHSSSITLKTLSNVLFKLVHKDLIIHKSKHYIGTTNSKFLISKKGLTTLENFKDSIYKIQKTLT